MSSLVTSQPLPQRNVRRSLVSWRRVVIAVTILSAPLFWTRSASASCGNYLYRNGKAVSLHSIPMNELNEISENNGATDNVPSEIPVRRCSGPNCSSSPFPLAPVPAAPSNLIRGFDQATVLESVEQTQNTRGAIEFPESERGARFEPSTVFRPPAA